MSAANADRLFGLITFGGLMLAAIICAGASRRHQLAGRLADQLDRLAAACRRYRRRRYPLLDQNDDEWEEWERYQRRTAVR